MYIFPFQYYSYTGSYRSSRSTRRRSGHYDYRSDCCRTASRRYWSYICCRLVLVSFICNRLLYNGSYIFFLRCSTEFLIMLLDNQDLRVITFNTRPTRTGFQSSNNKKHNLIHDILQPKHFSSFYILGTVSEPPLMYGETASEPGL